MSDRSDALCDGLAVAALALARRFAGGATLWSLSPAVPSHGRHVTVEFVHPVIMGARALPAMDVDSRAPVERLRILSKPGDVLLVIGAADDVTVIDALAHAEAFGLKRVWLGWGPPPAGGAEHILWTDADPQTAPWSGAIVLLYHLLWELTHICFEHPGLLAETEEVGPACTTCGDVACVAEVQDLATDGRATVLVAGRPEEVDCSLVNVGTGDLVLVHAGVAIAPVPVASAERP